MARRTIIKNIDKMRKYIWNRCQQGDSVWWIAKSFDRPTLSIHEQSARRRGVRPPERKRHSQRLNLCGCSLDNSSAIFKITCRHKVCLFVIRR